MYKKDRGKKPSWHNNHKGKPDRAQKFQPKCFLSDRQPAFTATGYLVPCCWVDNPWAWKDPKIAEFYDPKWHIDKQDSVMEIMHGEVFNKWWDMLEKRPEDAPQICKKYCGSDLNDKVTKKDHYLLPKEKHKEFKEKTQGKIGVAITKDDLK